VGFAALLAAADGAALDLLGAPVRYEPLDGAPADLVGVFEAFLQRTDPAAPGPAGMTVGPAVFLRAADLPDGAGRGDQVTVEGTTYRVQEVQLDAQGGALLHLLGV
jgi:hypothetical protein